MNRSRDVDPCSYRGRLPEPLVFCDSTHIRVGKRRLLFFAGCDYLRMAVDPRVLGAARDALATEGLNVAASRMTTGNHALYARLELALARFFGSPAAVLTATGYAANHVVAQALAGDIGVAFLDERAHPSLVDASALLGCPVVRFRHRSPDDWVARMREAGDGLNPLVMTDGVCAHDGGVAPLRAYLRLLPASGRILVDDSHGVGVLGEHGRGTVEVAGVGRRRVIQTASLSKAFGAYGGIVLCSTALAGRIAEKSGLFSGNTPLPLPLAAAGLASVRILTRDRKRRGRLAMLTRYVKGILKAVGFKVPQSGSPIIALPALGPERTTQFRAALLAAGIHPTHIRYPGTPAAGRFRFVISSEHTREQVDRLLGVLVGFLEGDSDTHAVSLLRPRGAAGVGQDLPRSGSGVKVKRGVTSTGQRAAARDVPQSPQRMRAVVRSCIQRTSELPVTV